MSNELLNVVTSIVEQARTGEQVEAFATHEREFSVKAYLGEVESLSSAEPRGVGIRVVRKARVGFSYTTDMTDDGIAEALAAARANANHATPDEHVGLAQPWMQPPTELPALYAEEQGEVDPQDKVAFAIELEEATRRQDARVRAVEEAGYADSLTEIALATSTGIAGHYRRSDAWCYSIAIAEEGDDTEVGFDFALGRSLAALDASAVARAAADKALSVLGAEKIASARMPVVLSPYVAGQFLGVLGGVLVAEAVQKGRSLFAARLGDEVAAPRVSLVDDGAIADAPASSPWDAEGVPTQHTEVISEGVLTSYLYDLASARRDGRDSTGNAARAGFKSPPHPSPTNMAFEPTGETAADVLARADGGLYVQDFHGVHSGANPVSGDFSVGATGRLIENGDLGAPVKEVTIAAPMLEILRGIVAVADDRRWLPFGGSYGGATTLVAEMTVAGL